MEQATARFLYWSLAECKGSNYSKVKKSYIFHCRIRGLNAFLVTVTSLSSCIEALGLRHISNRTIKSYMTGI